MTEPLIDGAEPELHQEPLVTAVVLAMRKMLRWDARRESVVSDAHSVAVPLDYGDCLMTAFEIETDWEAIGGDYVRANIEFRLTGARYEFNKHASWKAEFSVDVISFGV